MISLKIVGATTMILFWIVAILFINNLVVASNDVVLRVFLLISVLSICITGLMILYSRQPRNLLRLFNIWVGVGIVGGSVVSVYILSQLWTVIAVPGFYYIYQASFFGLLIAFPTTIGLALMLPNKSDARLDGEK
jgi:hypothetical protein